MKMTALIKIDLGRITDMYICGLCFSTADRKDKFCSKCGAQYARASCNCCAEYVYDYERLKKINQ